jgi:hypothetical protein
MRRRKSSAREALETALFCAAIAALCATLPLEPPANADADVCCDSLAILGRQGGSGNGPPTRRLPAEVLPIAGDVSVRF